MNYLLLFLACVVSSKACTCAPFSSLEKEFCISEWVLHVRATGRIRRKSTHFDPYYIYQNRIYLIEPIEVYRSPSNYTKLPSRVSTPAQPSICGIKLRNNTEYLLGGRGTGDGTLYGSLCHLHRGWGTVSTAERANLSNYTC